MKKLNDVLISITIPTIKDDITHQKKMIQKNTDDDLNWEIVVVKHKASASVNRNLCIEQAKGDIIVMIDDDIMGFYNGWIRDFITPLIENPDNISMITPRLINRDGVLSGQLGDNGDKNIPDEQYTVAKHTDETNLNIIGSSCIAFFKNDIRFDENYPGATYEDSDFCMQFAKAFPEKRIVINNRCKMIHLDEGKGRSINGENISLLNKKYFAEKWGIEI
jgi:glycosyltransferase involved in cell wall biosynthesis